MDSKRASAPQRREERSHAAVVHDEAPIWAAELVADRISDSSKNTECRQRIHMRGVKSPRILGAEAKRLCEKRHARAVQSSLTRAGCGWVRAHSAAA